VSEPAFVSATSVPEALAFLAEAGAEGKLLAGGTNLLVDYRHGKHRPRVLIDITRIKALQGWRDATSIRTYGALVTYHQLVEAADLGAELACLSDGAIVVGGPPIRFRGTVAGNIADASPAADIVPPFMVLAGEVTLDSLRGARRVLLRDFFTAYRRTVLAPDELITGIRVPLAGPGSGSAFHKFGNRDADAIAVVSTAAWVRVADGHIAEARVALGSVAPTVVRAPHVEAALRGRPTDPAAIGDAAAQVLADISPISDIRASAEYRRVLAPTLTRRAVLDAVARATGGIGTPR
jgi:carbon-monoxide dehydrogenase medium subunit